MWNNGSVLCIRISVRQLHFFYIVNIVVDLSEQQQRTEKKSSAAKYFSLKKIKYIYQMC